MYIPETTSSSERIARLYIPQDRLGEGATIGTSIDIERAIRLNRSLAQSLGWQDKIDQIVRLLGFTNETPNEPTFTQAISRWQIANNLNPDGIIGQKTWDTMQLALSPTSGSASRSLNSALKQSRIQWRTSPNFGSRRDQPITAIIYHYTAGPSLEGTVRWFSNKESKVSAHFVVGKNGQIVQMVPLDKAAWHAGNSILAGKRGVNLFSVGIEIVNWGKLTKRGNKYFTGNGRLFKGIPIRIGNNYWEPYSEEQYKALSWLTWYLITQIPTITHITGHEHIAIPKGRKIDPGDAFNWNRIRETLGTAYRGYIGP